MTAAPVPRFAELPADESSDALTLVTTEKDMARLRTGQGLADWAKAIVPFVVTLEFDDAAGLRKFVTDRLFKAHLLEGSNIGPLVAILAVGVCVGFLPFNFNPARIFMGDAGAMFLGLLMAATTITVGGRTADQFSGQTYFFFAPLFIPVVILGVLQGPPGLQGAISFFPQLQVVAGGNITSA